VRRIEQLRELGAKTKKNFPAKLLDSEEAANEKIAPVNAKHSPTHPATHPSTTEEKV